MRRQLALLTLLFSFNVACGATVLGDPTGDGGADTGEIDTGALPDTNVPWPDSDILWETGYDTSVPDTHGGCGWGACYSGESCFDGCNECWCDASGIWSCTTKWCEDTGTVDTSPPPPPPICPSYLPKEGTSCSGPAKCDYWKACGTSDLAYCDAASSKWKIYYSDCPPPPPPPEICPPKVPAEGSACKGYASCAWNNGCGALTYGYCEGTRWWVSESGCAPGCPASKPTSGLACKSPGSSSCTYISSTIPGGYCQSNCFCAEDYRWACIPGGCSSGGGGWVDAGPFPASGDAGFAETW